MIWEWIFFIHIYRVVKAQSTKCAYTCLHIIHVWTIFILVSRWSHWLHGFRRWIELGMLTQSFIVLFVHYSEHFIATASSRSWSFNHGCSICVGIVRRRLNGKNFTKNLRELQFTVLLEASTSQFHENILRSKTYINHHVEWTKTFSVVSSISKVFISSAILAHILNHIPVYLFSILWHPKAFILIDFLSRIVTQICMIGFLKHLSMSQNKKSFFHDDIFKNS